MADAFDIFTAAVVVLIMAALVGTFVHLIVKSGKNRPGAE